jgi:uncharacterized membrane protein (DUF4010 family)
MDAITLSTARLVDEGRLESDTAWRLILVAMLSNLGAKLAIVAILGQRRLLAWSAALFSVAAAGIAILIAFWP